MEDNDYIHAGAEMLNRTSILSLPFVLGVKETQPGDHALMTSPMIIMGYQHFAEDFARTQAAIETSRKGPLFLALETMQDHQGRFPTLAPMSEIAAEVLTQLIPHFFLSPYGSGMLPSGVKGSKINSMKAVVLGGGVVGKTAAVRLAGMGLSVYLLEKDESKRESLKSELWPRLNVTVLDSGRESLGYAFSNARVLLSGMYLKGTNPEKIVTNELLKLMAKPAITLFVDIDQGGSYEGKLPKTSIFDREKSVIEASANMLPAIIPGVFTFSPPNVPSLAAVDSSEALAKAVMPFAKTIARHGLETAVLHVPEILNGINIFNGEICEPNLARSFGLPYASFERMIAVPNPA